MEEFLFEIHGKIPDYIPPKINYSGKVNYYNPKILKKSKKTRNFVKENIDNLKHMKKKPKVISVPKHDSDNNH